MKIRLEKICKSYTAGKRILEPLDLEIASGELFFLLGPSGCGKSTLLRLVAGFLAPDSGKIYFDDQDVTDLVPEKRNVPMVFQNYALWPHLSVYDNVALGLKARKITGNALKKQAMEALEVVRMQDFADRKTPQLSGGQQQRVALARALAVAPEVLLLDEPLSNLDAQLRDQMREELRDICRARRLTAIYVTHDRREALSMADRIALLQNGRVAQLGTPEALYRRPVNAFSAAFLGDANFISGIVREAGTVETRFGLWCDLDTGTRPAGSHVQLMIRPESLAIDRKIPEGGIAFQTELTGGSYLGEMAGWRFGEITVNELAPDMRKAGSMHTLSVMPSAIVVLD